MSIFFFLISTATPDFYTLSLHDALPIFDSRAMTDYVHGYGTPEQERLVEQAEHWRHRRSEEHTSELQSHSDLVCRLLLEKKKKRRSNGCERVRDTPRKSSS